MCDFVGIDLPRESVPDAATLLSFPRLLPANDLTKALTFGIFGAAADSAANFAFLGFVLHGSLLGLHAPGGHGMPRTQESGQARRGWQGWCRYPVPAAPAQVTSVTPTP